MSATDLTTLLTPRPVGPHRWSLDVPDGWQQGRGAFGGFVVGALIRAASLDAEPERSLRSLTAQLCGPLQPGPAELRTEILRAGNAVSTIAVRIVQADEVQAHAVGIFGRARVSDLDRSELEGEAPPWQDWRTLEPLPVEPPLGPVFAQHFEFRSEGPFPLSGGPPIGRGFVRPKHPGSDRGPAYVAACMDAWWPTLYPVIEAPRPMATLDYTIQFAAPLTPAEGDGPLAFRSRALHVHEGYLIEHRELWTPEGRLVALNQQTFAVIK